MDLDNSVVGLTRDKVLKVSDFRTKVNVALMDADRSDSLQLKDAVKYLHAAKFDVAKAEEIYHNYQQNRQSYKLHTTHSQQLHAEIRSRKLEILSARDSNGALLLLYTASRHTPKSHDSLLAIQLFFHTLDQISDSNETQTKGIAVLMDMRECSAPSFDSKYAKSIFSILLDGYPLYVNMIYIIEPQSWFKSHKDLPPYKELQKQGKITSCTVTNLLTHIPQSSLPQSLNGPCVASFIPTSESVLSSPSRGCMTPPTRKPKPLTHDEANNQPAQGSVNKMKGRFNAAPAKKPIIISPKPRLNESKSPKSVPSPKLTQSVSLVEHSTKVKVPILPPVKNTDSKKDNKWTSHFKKSKSFDEDSKENGKALLSPEHEMRSLVPNETMQELVKTVKTEGNPKKKSPSSQEEKKQIIKLRGDTNKGSDKQTIGTPPPSYSPPFPPSETQAPAINRYVNIDVLSKPKGNGTGSKGNGAESKGNGAESKVVSPYTVTTVSSPDQSGSTQSQKTTPTQSQKTTPTQSINSAVKLRDPITTCPIPKSQPDAKKKTTCYENIFFTKEDEDEGVCLNSEVDDEVIYENFGPDEGNRWMTTDELEQYITRKGKEGLSAEYIKLKNEPLSGPATAFRKQHNTSKNRYKDVVCYDTTRVVLEKIDNVEGSDYIHANYVNGYEKKQGFILTQGPLKRTVCDYWRMLWEKEVFVIVMTTKCVELAKLKCAQYWPDDGKPAAVFGNVGVSVLQHEQWPSFEFRKLLVQCEDKQRTLMHYQFTGWPDYGVPDTGKDIVDLLYMAREAQEGFGRYVEHPERFPLYGPPVVIHCSAGIGRSGTFCALDYCIDELRMKGRVNIQHCVRQLRQQRAFAIQTDEQYRFCYKTVLEYGKYLKEVLKI